ncbi:NAD(P)-dependent alcohol dehydrogenase [Rhodococcus sp. T2V]|uniref:NAD(P)-dependent alcohol dehydrogenase n=1 Tax=Rhodococcus sp. T2V TaxID=3034164 RepID=UPI0023E1B166|nr:NAD(P)-dependent alcohol dehydrogenase [Rhodococcus sp. T2V]MDF3310568.1 NAD(P)-dependent alcohol dehydrogenase [Rhodococcus sp. T2V]
MSPYRTTAAVVPAENAPFLLEEVEIDSPRPSEVLVRVVASGMCQADLTARSGGIPFPLPGVLGHEGSGVVEAVGTGVSDFSVGDHVVLSFAFCGHCRPCRTGHPAYCDSWTALNLSGGKRPDGSTALRRHGEALHGHFFGQSSFATLALVPAHCVIKVPPDAPLELLGPLACGIQTGAQSVLKVLRPGPEETLAIFGAGGVGLSALIAAANLTGATTCVVDIHPARLELATRLGASHVVNARDDVVESLRDLTGGRGVDVALEASGAAGVLTQAIKTLAPMGRCAAVGGGGRDGEASFNTLQAIVRGIQIIGVNQGDALPRESIPMLIELHRRGRFPFDQLLQVYPFEDINQAATEVASGGVIKAVLRMP